MDSQGSYTELAGISLILGACVAGKKNGNGGTKREDSAAVVAAIRDLGTRIEASVGSRIDKTNERIDTLVTDYRALVESPDIDAVLGENAK